MLVFQVIFSMRTATKLQNNLEILQISGGVFSKKYVCTRTRTHIVLIALKFA